MGRPRNPERDKSMQRYLDADGKIETARTGKAGRGARSKDKENGSRRRLGRSLQRRT